MCLCEMWKISFIFAPVRAAVETRHCREAASTFSQGDKVIYSKSVGFTDVEQEIRANENSKYRIGSISKTFTAVLTLKAMEEKKLSLNQTIDKWFPTIDNADKITIEHLLRHRSGLYNHLDEWTKLGWHTQPKTEAKMIEIIIKGGNGFAPDTKMAYSNSNYILLTYILEKIYKKPYSEVLKEKIVKPLGLKNTYLGGKINIQNGECDSDLVKFSTDFARCSFIFPQAKFRMLIPQTV